MPTDLSVQLGPLTLRNPLVTASGTFGYGKEYADLVAPETLGAITVKGISAEPWQGNPPPRCAEVSGGLLNSIGLQNPGVETFINHADYLPWLSRQNTHIFVNIWGRTIAQYVDVARRLDEAGASISALEINISCPNIKAGGVAFGTDLDLAGEVTAAVRETTQLPLITKLSPNVTHIADFACRVVDAGSDIVSLINTMPGMAIDVETWQPKLASKTGGLSGPAIKPLAVKAVSEVYQAVDAPIIGMGGVCTAEDAIEVLLAGATAVGIGSATFRDPHTTARIKTELEAYLNKHNLNSVQELIGALR